MDFNKKGMLQIVCSGLKLVNRMSRKTIELKVDFVHVILALTL
jgi:hypothetical protein